MLLRRKHAVERKHSCLLPPFVGNPGQASQVMLKPAFHPILLKYFHFLRNRTKQHSRHILHPEQGKHCLFFSQSRNSYGQGVGTHFLWGGYFCIYMCVHVFVCICLEVTVISGNPCWGLNVYHRGSLVLPASVGRPVFKMQACCCPFSNNGHVGPNGQDNCCLTLHGTRVLSLESLNNLWTLLTFCEWTEPHGTRLTKYIASYNHMHTPPPHQCFTQGGKL